MAAEGHGADLPQRTRPPAPGAARSRDHERVCHHCRRGHCARCNDPLCTCCYGNEE